MEYSKNSIILLRFMNEKKNQYGTNLMKSKEITIIQLTDLHIPEKNNTAEGIDSRLNFVKILNKIREFKIDYLIITGDICYSYREIEIYIFRQRLGPKRINFEFGRHHAAGVNDRPLTDQHRPCCQNSRQGQNSSPRIDVSFHR
jgi:hypothetical protein